MVTGLVPHVGGPIIAPGCPTVLIGSQPAARISDMAICVGPPDVIVQGSPIVIIGGMPASRIGDMTSHGGVIVSGMANVLIGEQGSGGGGGGGNDAAPAPASGPGAAAASAVDDPTADPLVAKSPTLSKQLAALKKDGWQIKYGKGPGSYCSRPQKLISLDSSLKGDSKRITQALSHEAGHALYTPSLDASSRAAYIRSNLQDEGAATMNNIMVRREVLAADKSIDIGIAGNAANHAKYEAAYNGYLKDGNVAKSQQSIGSIFGQGEKTSTTNQTYEDYYGAGYDKVYGKKK